MEIIYKILAAVLVVAVPVLTGFLCDMIHKAGLKLIQSAEDDRVKALIGEITNAVTNAVRYVNQTFVDELKKSNVFGEDEEYAQEAFEEAYKTTIETLSQDALFYIENTFGDVHKYLEVRIENEVKNQKD